MPDHVIITVVVVLALIAIGCIYTCIFMKSNMTAHSPEFIRKKSAKLASDELVATMGFNAFSRKYPWADSVMYYDLISLHNKGMYTFENIQKIFE